MKKKIGFPWSHFGKLFFHSFYICIQYESEEKPLVTFFPWSNHRMTILHTLTCQTRLEIENFKILDNCSNKKDLRILESIYIRKMKPQLNNDQSSSPLYIVD